MSSDYSQDPYQPVAGPSYASIAPPYVAPAQVPPPTQPTAGPSTPSKPSSSNQPRPSSARPSTPSQLTSPPRQQPSSSPKSTSGGLFSTAWYYSHHAPLNPSLAPALTVSTRITTIPVKYRFGASVWDEGDDLSRPSGDGTGSGALTGKKDLAFGGSEKKSSEEPAASVSKSSSDRPTKAPPPEASVSPSTPSVSATPSTSTASTSASLPPPSQTAPSAPTPTAPAPSAAPAVSIPSTASASSPSTFATVEPSPSTVVPQSQPQPSSSKSPSVSTPPSVPAPSSPAPVRTTSSLPPPSASLPPKPQSQPSAAQVSKASSSSKSTQQAPTPSVPSSAASSSSSITNSTPPTTVPSTASTPTVSTPKTEDTTPTSSTINLPASSSAESSVPAPTASEPTPPPAPAPPPVKKPPTSWAALLRPPPSANKPSSSAQAPSSAAGSSSNPANRNVAPQKKSKSSSLAQLLAVGAAPGEYYSYPTASSSSANSPSSSTIPLPSSQSQSQVTGVRGVTPRGLINRGNLCFVNSILQVLLFTPSFYNLFSLISQLLPADLAGEYPLVDAMILFLREFAPADGSPPKAPVPPMSSTTAFPPPPSASSSSTTTAAATNGKRAPISRTSSTNGKASSPIASSSTSIPVAFNETASSSSSKPEKTEAFIPEPVYLALSRISRFSFMRHGHQEDAEEFLGFFLNTLHEEVLGLLARQPASEREKVVAGERSGKVEEGVKIAGQREGGESSSSAGASGGGGGADASGWMEVGKKNKASLLRTTESRPSSVTNLFTGTLRSTLRTPSHPSLKPSITIEPFSPLQLDIHSPQIITIPDAIRNLTKPEIIHGVTLPGGRGEAEAEKTCVLEGCPRVLVLHLKRFGWMMSGGGSNGDGERMGARKNGKVVGYGPELEIPRETISPAHRTQTPVRYKLFGVVYHHGPTVSSGHYTSAVLSQATGSWLHVDDDLVSPVSVHDVCVTENAAKEGKSGEIGGRERCAYLLFYQRVQ